MVAGTGVPDPWADAPAVRLDESVVSEPTSREALVERLHRAWVGREPVVVAWDGPDNLLEVRETEAAPPWQLGASYLFAFERLRFLCFSNHYDARHGPPKWWWAIKARRIGAEPGGPADVLLADGQPVWVDGGPRHPLLTLDHPVVHGESVDLGEEGFVSAPVAPVDEGLAADQREAVGHLRGPARIIAPAGSGKTRTLTARLTHMMGAHRIEPEIVTALAYNERAAAELRDRLGVGRSLARTIHSLGWEILREARPRLDLLEERGVRETLDQLLSIPRIGNADPAGAYLEALSAVRSRLLDPAEVETSRDDVPGFGDVFEAYRSRLYVMGRVDYAEQVYGAIEVLLTDPELRARWQQRCRHLLVDEFQDLTPAFVLLLRLLASPELSVFGVGDDDQVIYGFDGADPGFLIDFDRYFPGSTAHALVTNYRCPPAVVDAATNLLSYNRRRIHKTIRSARTDDTKDALVIDRRPGEDLAVAAAERVAGWLAAGVAPSDIAMLSRVNSSLIPLKAALVERGITTSDLLGPASLDRTAVRALFAWMRVTLRPDEMRRSDLLAAIRRPGRGLTRLARELITRPTSTIDDLGELGGRLDGKQAARWAALCDDLVDVATVAARGDAAALISSVIDDVGLGSSAQTLDSGRRNASRSGHLDDLVAIQRAAALHAEAAEFEPWLRRMIGVASDPGGVTLSSVHRVKGMEWRHVIVFGADRGAMPHDLAEDLEEERRVFHVALTRAIDQAVVLADATRPSPFLAELDGSASITHAAPSTTVDRTPTGRRTGDVPLVGDRVRLRGGFTGEVVAVDSDDLTVRVGESELNTSVGDVVEVIRAKAPALGAGSAELIDALKTWRHETAQRLGVPAYVVLHDKTIDEIARRRPSSERELLTVSGIGSSKLDQYGDDILGVVTDATQ